MWTPSEEEKVDRRFKRSAQNLVTKNVAMTCVSLRTVLTLLITGLSQELIQWR